MIVDISDPRLFNPVYLPYLQSKHPIEIYYGGSGSGKSQFIAQKLIIKCLASRYYRLIFSRKTAEAIRDSQFQLFKDIINNWNLEKLFLIKESTMDIICRNGNMMLSHGLDKPEKIKSIAEPTDVWLEESTEFTEEDFDQLSLRLRTQKTEQIQVYLSFNPIDERHWIKKRFFDEEQPGVSILHTTFEHNKFLDPSYKQKLENLAKFNPNYYRIYKLGHWGKAEVKRPYMYNFDRGKHVDRTGQIFRYQLRFSWDFNLEPLVCIVGHIWEDKLGEHFHIFREYVQEDGRLEVQIDKIKIDFDATMLANAVFTGDATGNAGRVGGLAPWKIIKASLNISDRRLQLPNVNPNVSNNRFLCNAILANHPDVTIDENCRTLINEMQYTEADEDGNILKKDRKKDSQKADGLDCWRYMCNTWLRHYERGGITKLRK